MKYQQEMIITFGSGCHAGTSGIKTGTVFRLLGSLFVQKGCEIEAAR